MNSFIKDLGQPNVATDYESAALAGEATADPSWLVDLSDEELEVRLNKGVPGQTGTC